ncbi:MAG TPA: cytochrome P450 [Bryobacteraceae bacterium]|nr:cytochrome P450 [Bryobacteraceae bacterium]
MNFWAAEPPADAYFDPRLNAWIVSRYRDVAAALREPLLIPALARSATPAVAVNPEAHADFRARSLRALSSSAMAEWEQRFALAANRLADALPAGEPVDLVERYARPLSLEIAGIAANLSAEECARLAPHARAVFDSACEPYEDVLAAAQWKAIVALTGAFRGSPPWTMQMFIALAHSLPAFLGNAWLALAEQPVEIAVFSTAMDELLRFAGPAKAQFRQAGADLAMGDCTIAREQRVILRLDIANRDPDEFPDPHTLRFDRGPAHLALGGGIHGCVGALLVKSAAASAIETLRDRYLFEEYQVVPADCFAIRYVSSFTVKLRSR